MILHMSPAIFYFMRFIPYKHLAFVALASGLMSHLVADEKSIEAEIILVVGAAGESQYEFVFSSAIERVQQAAELSPAELTIIRETTGNSSPKQQLISHLESISPSGSPPLWLIFIGHGTFDGVDARFNLIGPDITCNELAATLLPVQRQLVIVLGFSGSAPFVAPLAGPNRSILSATRSGYELNFSRFGPLFCQALVAPDADIDKDNQVSLLEAFLHASTNTSEYYNSQKRLMSEHAMIDDNGDGLATPAEWFSGLYPSKSAVDGKPLDGSTAHTQVLIPSDIERSLSMDDRQSRNHLEAMLRDLKKNQPDLDQNTYRTRLESILTDLARIYFPESVEAEVKSNSPDAESPPADEVETPTSEQQ